jgi:hypothetical protein
MQLCEQNDPPRFAIIRITTPRCWLHHSGAPKKVVPDVSGREQRENRYSKQRGVTMHFRIGSKQVVLPSTM